MANDLPGATYIEPGCDYYTVPVCVYHNCPNGMTTEELQAQVDETGNPIRYFKFDAESEELYTAEFEDGDQDIDAVFLQ